MLEALKRIYRPTPKQDQRTPLSGVRVRSAGNPRRVRPMSFTEKMRRDPFERLAKI